MLEKADWKYQKIIEERQQWTLEHQKAVELQNKIIWDRKAKADEHFLKWVEGLKEKG